MLYVNSVSKNYGERVLFENVNFYINSDDRIGLIGSNGSGKSTLLKIIAGIEEASTGTIQKPNDIIIEYLPQEIEFDSENTLINEASYALNEIKELKEKIDVLHQKLLNDPENISLLDTLGKYEERYQYLDAYKLNHKVEKVLSGLGFKESDFNRKVNEFSGGWKMRILLAQILLKEPSLLLLDEPTNHLDLDSLEWLENYLKTFRGGIILVSHDKTFLNNLTNKTIEITSGKVNEYKGNYDFYEIESAKRKENLLATYKNQQEKIKQTQRFIERFRYKATKARQVQSRIKMLEKMEFIEPEKDEEQIAFFFPESYPSGKVLVNINSLTKSYGNNIVLDSINLIIERGDKIAILGPNGTGKSTLLKILAGIDKNFTGDLVFGYNVLKSYFAQEQSLELDKSKTIFQTIDEIAIGETRKMIRTLLGSFLFSGDDIFKTISVLSGGEKSRVALAKMLLSPSNFLILDEPTNHLDIYSKDILKNALKDFNGSFIIASHDRDFLNPIINKVIEIQNKKIKIYPGNIDDYIYLKNKYSIENSTNKRNTIEQSPQISLKEKKRIEAEKRQRKYSLTKPVREKIQKIEKEIEINENIIRELENEMSNPDYFKDAEKVKSNTKKYDNTKIILDELYLKWEKLQNELVQIENSVF